MLHVFSNVFDRWRASPVGKMQGLLGEIMCSPFFCNHVISTPFNGVSSRRNLRKDRFDTLSIPNCDQEGSCPWCSSRKHRRAKNSSHGLQCVEEEPKEEKRWCIGSLSEQSKVHSITSGTWVDRRVVCKTRRTCAGGPFIQVNSQSTPTPRINLDSSSQQFGQNGPMSERPGYAEAVRIRNRLCKKSGEANGLIHPSQQTRQRSHNPFWKCTS